MRIKLHLKFEKLELPINYNHIVQAVILRWLGDENYSRFIHDIGYKYNKRTYKLFTFSRIEGKYTLDKINKKITYYDNSIITISSVDDKFLNYLVNTTLINEELLILGQAVSIDSITSDNNYPKSGSIIKAISPIVVYSTFQIKDKKKTYYYCPMEKEFNELIAKNLINKYRAIYNKESENKSFYISPTGTNKEHIIIYKSTIIKGWSGFYKIEGDDELIKLAYDTGLGSKNSQGFGCIEMTT